MQKVDNQTDIQHLLLFLIFDQPYTNVLLLNKV